MKREPYRQKPVNLEEAVDLLFEEKRSRLFKMLTPELLSSKKRSGVGHDYHANIRINHTAPEDFTVAHGPDLNPGRKMFYEYDPVLKRKIGKMKTVGRPGQSNLSVVAPGAEFGSDKRRGTGQFYRYDNVLEYTRGPDGKMKAKPKQKAYDTLLDMLTKLNVSDSEILGEDAYTPDEVKKYLDNIFEQLVEWFEDSAEKDEANPTSDFSHYADFNSDSMKNFKQEEHDARMSAFEDKRTEFLDKIANAKDLNDVALTLQPVVEFQKRMDTVQNEVAKAQRSGELPFVIEQSGDYHGKNPARVFFADPDAIFVEAAGVWSRSSKCPTPNYRGFDRRVDTKAVTDQKRWIAFIMPRHVDWSKKKQLEKQDEWRQKFNNGAAPTTMLDRSKERHYASQMDHVVDPVTKKKLYDEHPYWCDVRFTTRKDGGKDFFDELIEKYSPAGKQAAEGATEAPEEVAPEAPEGEGVSVEHKRDIDLYTADTQNMVYAAIAVCNDYGIKTSQIGLSGKALAKLDADEEAGTYGIRVNQTQPYNIKMFATIVSRLADVALHGKMQRFSSYKLQTSDDTMKDIESNLVAGMVLYNCGYKDVANDFLHKATEDFQYMTFDSSSDENKNDRLEAACHSVSTIVNEITKAIGEKIKLLGENNEDEQPQE